MDPPKIYDNFVTLLGSFESSPDHVSSEVKTFIYADAKKGDLWQKEDDELNSSLRKALYEESGSWKNILLGTKNAMQEIKQWHKELDKNESLWHLRSAAFGEDGQLNSENTVDLYQQGISELDNLKYELERMTNPSADNDKPSLADLISRSKALASHSSFQEWNSFYESKRLDRDKAERVVLVFENEYAKQVSDYTGAGLPGCVETRNTKRMLRFLDDSLNGEKLISELRATMKKLIPQDDFECISEPGCILWTNEPAVFSEAMGEIMYPTGDNGDTIDKILGLYFSDSPDNKVRHYIRRGSHLCQLPSKEVLKRCLALWRMAAIARALKQEGTGLYDKETAYREPNQFFQITLLNNSLDTTRRTVTAILTVLQSFVQILSDTLAAVNNAKVHMHDMFINIMVNEGGMALEDRDSFRDALGKIKLGQWRLSELQLPAGKHKRVKRGVIKCRPEPLHRASMWEVSASPEKRDDFLLIHGLSFLDFRSDQHLHLLTSVGADKVPALRSDVNPHQAALSWIQIHESWNYRLLDVCFRSGAPTRQSGENGYLKHHDIQVEFNTPYPPGVVPTVVCWLQGLHMDRQFGYRVDVEASQTTNKGFRVTLMTWDQTKFFEATVGCFAYKTDNGAPGIFTTTRHFSKQELCTATVPVTVQIPEGRFDVVPKCIGLIKRIDMRENRDPRLFARVEDVTRESVRFVGDCWEDTLMWGAEVLVIAASDV